MNNERESFSRLGFILAAAGSAIGLGNLWKFPYHVGENGGGLFVLVYLVAVALIGFPVLLAEISLGRHTQKNPVGAFLAIRPKSPWKLAGYLGVASGFMILSFYAVIAGTVLGYFVKAVGGSFSNITGEAAASMYQSFTGNAWVQIGLTAVFIFITVYVVSKGVSGGIEKYSKILMPALVVILILLLFRSLTLEGAGKGIGFYLKPDFSALNPQLIIDAMGQAFFSLSLGMGTMITYGSYVSKKENLPASAGWITISDTGIALLAGFIIFPAIFSQGMDPAQGEGVMFNILPVLFDKMPGGIIFGPMFFILLAIAALTSSISMLEVPVSFIIDEQGWGRRKATFIIGAIAFLFAVPAALSQGAVPFLQNLPIFNTSFLQLWIIVWGTLSISIGAFLVAFFVGHIWKADNALLEIKAGTKRVKIAGIWKISIMFVAPIIIFIVLLSTVL